MAGPDLSIVTASIDFASVTGAVLSALAALIVIYIAVKGAQLVLDAVRGTMRTDSPYVSHEQMTEWLERGDISFDEAADLQTRYGKQWLNS